MKLKCININPIYTSKENRDFVENRGQLEEDEIYTTDGVLHYDSRDGSYNYRIQETGRLHNCKRFTEIDNRWANSVIESIEEIELVL